MSSKILVLDDEKEIADVIALYLRNDGYEVETAYSGREALGLIEKEEPDLALLDVMLPDIDGFRILQKIREKYRFPVIMLTAKTEYTDKIAGLTLGADDYIAKPFNPLELTARVKSQLRRYTSLNPGAANADSEREVSVHNLSINRDTRVVISYGREVKLTPIEFDILYLLASNAGKVFSTDEIFERVWNEKMYEANNTVMVHIRRLREKVEMDPKNAEIIKTVWGVGYRIEK